MVHAPTAKRAYHVTLNGNTIKLQNLHNIMIFSVTHVFSFKNVYMYIIHAFYPLYNRSIKMTRATY